MKPQITLVQANDGRTHYKVLLCPHQDWSGWADTFDEAVARTKHLSDLIDCSCSTATNWKKRTIDHD
jgi:hypothetical protein